MTMLHDVRGAERAAQFNGLQPAVEPVVPPMVMSARWTEGVPLPLERIPPPEPERQAPTTPGEITAGLISLALLAYAAVRVF